MRASALAFVFPIFLAGCITSDLVGQHRDVLDTSKRMRSSERMATRHITTTKEIPLDAEDMGDFSVVRCQKYMQSEEPSDATLSDDLLRLALAEDADGMTNLRFSQAISLSNNCWRRSTGTAVFFRIQK